MRLMKDRPIVPRVRGGLKITHADGTVTTERVNYRTVNETIARGDGRSRKPKRNRERDQWRTLRSRYHSTCENCKGPIKPLDQILWKPGHSKHLNCDKHRTSVLSQP